MFLFLYRKVLTFKPFTGGKTLERLWEDLRKTLGRLWEDSNSQAKGAWGGSSHMRGGFLGIDGQRWCAGGGRGGRYAEGSDV